jgi:hypothetical protein
MIDFNELLTNEEQRAFWDNATRAPNGCLLWNGTHNGAQKRAQYWRKGERYMASHVAYSLYHGGAVPQGMLVLHHCDDPRCIEPECLWLGSQLDNMRDCSEKGRICRGSARQNTNPNDPAKTRLDEDLVYFARLVYHKGLMRICDIARWYKISHAACRDMLLGINWKHVPMPEEETNGLQ